MQTTGIILAGGKSTRMGTNKALLDINGKKVIERIIDELRHNVNNMIIVTNSFEDYKFLQLPMVKDRYKGMGPLAGIHAGLSASDTERNLIVACDMPFVSPALGTLLLEELSEYQAVVPEIEGQLHPLFAAYRKDVQEEIEEALKREQLRIRSFFDRIHVKILTETQLENLGYHFNSTDFYNMNHPEEYHQAKNMSKGRKERVNHEIFSS
ncbi:molybdenum cofactor guanylyltransferase [Bacillus dakarensis]|uniref:molybdenum cofactor guanylyltransferase n=1 Tax=Robertmurraya dakarensis TaxID=1926278 RepID=UPI00098219A1|nr:molybdenum cofactor guanylyltransferase [Bacillus dakarensis]